jgi:rod shape-determining protein MreD
MARYAGYFWVFVILLVTGHLLLRVGFGFGPPAPDLLTVAALLGARRLRASAAALLGFGLGLIEDALALTAFGATSLALVVVSFLGARSRDLFEGDSLLFLGVYFFLGKWLRDAILYLLGMAAGTGGPPAVLFVDGALAALVTAVAGIVTMLLYRAVTGDR